MLNLMYAVDSSIPLRFSRNDRLKYAKIQKLIY